MTSLTERYLAAALRGIPERERPDVERELRSSIDDAVEDRLAGGEERLTAETVVLEGLGDPTRLGAGIRGRPLYLIGPELFLQYRQLLVLLLAIVVPIVAAIVGAVALTDSGDYLRAIFRGIGAGLNVGVYTAFWVTLIFALLERVDSARDARTALSGAKGKWTVDSLPELASARVSVVDTVGEVLTLLLTLGGMIVLSNFTGFTDDRGNVITILAPTFQTFWVPVLIAVLIALVALHVVMFRVGRWTMPLALVHAALQVAFSAPFIALALTGSLITPEFAAEIGWPPLAEGDGPVMVWLAVGVLLVTAWEIIDGFRRARRA